MYNFALSTADWPFIVCWFGQVDYRERKGCHNSADLDVVLSEWEKKDSIRQWQYVTPHGDILVFSAYYVQNKHFEKPEIRVIAAMDSSGGLKNRIEEADVRCTCTNIDRGIVREWTVKAERVDELPDHHGKRRVFTYFSGKLAFFKTFNP